MLTEKAQNAARFIKAALQGDFTKQERAFLQRTMLALAEEQLNYGDTKAASQASLDTTKQHLVDIRQRLKGAQ